MDSLTPALRCPEPHHSVLPICLSVIRLSWWAVKVGRQWGLGGVSSTKPHPNLPTRIHGALWLPLSKSENGQGQDVIPELLDSFEGRKRPQLHSPFPIWKSARTLTQVPSLPPASCATWGEERPSLSLQFSHLGNMGEGWGGEVRGAPHGECKKAAES